MFAIGAIQMIRDTLGGGGGVSHCVTKYHMGGGREAKMSRDNFYW